MAFRNHESSEKSCGLQIIIEVRDSQTGYLVPVRDGPGALPDMESSWDVAVAAAVSWKMPKYKEMQMFSKMGMSGIWRNVNWSEIKAPAGAS